VFDLCSLNWHRFSTLGHLGLFHKELMTKLTGLIEGSLVFKPSEFGLEQFDCSLVLTGFWFIQSSA
jgi:hypothetical protein